MSSSNAPKSFSKKEHQKFAAPCIELCCLAEEDSNGEKIRRILDGNSDLRDYVSTNDEWNADICNTWGLWIPPLHHASENNSVGNIDILVKEYGMRVDAKWRSGTEDSSDCWTPLSQGIIYHQLEAVEKLLCFGADPFVGGRYSGRDYDNALELAERRNAKEIVQLLKTSVKEPSLEEKTKESSSSKFDVKLLSRDEKFAAETRKAEEEIQTLKETIRKAEEELRDKTEKLEKLRKQHAKDMESDKTT